MHDRASTARRSGTPRHPGLGEIGELTLRDWAVLGGGDPEPFGAVEARLAWHPRPRLLGLRDDTGRLVAAGGADVVEVEVAGTTFSVVGIGGLIVAPAARGTGAMRIVADALARLATTLGPDKAMIFCAEALVGLYESRGYRPISEPVTVEQPGGRIVMPLAAMWRPVHAGSGATWPAGRVAVCGLPF